MKQSIAIVGPNLLDQSKGSFHIHSGCGDLCKYHEADTDWIVDVESIQEIVEAVYEDILAEDPESTWEDYLHDFHILLHTELPLNRGVIRI